MKNKEHQTSLVCEPNRRRAFDLVMKLMSLPGKSGEEGTVVDYVKQRLLAAGAKKSQILSDSAHRRTILTGQVGNLVLKLPGTQRSPRRLLASHLDTVPICVGSRPQKQGKLVRSADPATGLGADNRAGVATILCAALEILERKLPHPPLTFCWFVQEEVGLQGSRFLKKSMLGNPRLAFNWDGGVPTKLTIGATGAYRLKFDIRGVASHAGGAPERGVSAIAIAALAIADLQRGGWHGDVRKGQRRGTSNVGFILGGEATNVVTDHVSVKAEARSHDPKFRLQLCQQIEKAFQKAIRQVKSIDGKKGSVSIHRQLDYESFLLDSDEPCVVIAEQAIAAIGEQSERAVANGGIDANWLFQHGIPTVSMGCGQLNPHMVSEGLDIDQFHTACRIALRLATKTEV